MRAENHHVIMFICQWLAALRWVVNVIGFLDRLFFWLPSWRLMINKPMKSIGQRITVLRVFLKLWMNRSQVGRWMNSFVNERVNFPPRQGMLILDDKSSPTVLRGKPFTHGLIIEIKPLLDEMKRKNTQQIDLRSGKWLYDHERQDFPRMAIQARPTRSGNKLWNYV